MIIQTKNTYSHGYILICDIRISLNNAIRKYFQYRVIIVKKNITAIQTVKIQAPCIRK